ncbi:Uncharacterized protein TPAR_01118 [Tolypocladium paradoxum]|uniref:Fucose-specific lectin n=1 Tax=Tolypocladium paradoxum TaxID=94208 RepID=A0A2S4L8H0_9HYPO|nr:Uncharacterized protein TPAR_01118 [Tolypocladium paradoxum]
MPVDVPWLLRQEERNNTGEPSSWSPPPPNYRKAPMQNQETIHNHYYPAEQKTARWYRRKRWFWTVVAAIAFVVVAIAIVLGVVLKLELKKDEGQSEAATESSSIVTHPTPESTTSSTSLTTSLSTTSSSSTTALASTSSSSRSETVPTHSPPSSKDTVIGFLTSFLATHTGIPRPSSASSSRSTTSSSSPSSSTSSASTSSTSTSASTSTSTSTSTSASTSSASTSSASTSSTSMSTSSTSTITKAVETTSVAFRLSGKSQLASAYVNNNKAKFHRRLLVWQDDKSDLIATEWSGNGKAHYRIRDKLGSWIPQAKHGTPLAVAASDSGTIHVFFLDTKDTITHLYETAVGDWKTGTVQSKGDPIVTARFSALSAALHQSTKDAQLLAVAYQGAEQKLRLAVNHEPKEETEWQVVDVTTLSHSVAGQSDSPCFSLAGDWQNIFGGTEASYRRLLMAVLDDDGVVAWECAVDFFEPPVTRFECQQLNDTFKDDRGKGITASPPPQQLGWIRLTDPSDTKSTGIGYDFSLLCLDANGVVQESHVAAGAARKAGPGLDTKMAVRAMSTTDEAILFAASGEDLYVYRLDKDSWKWSSQGSLLST